MQSAILIFPAMPKMVSCQVDKLPSTERSTTPTEKTNWELFVIPPPAD